MKTKKRRIKKHKVRFLFVFLLFGSITAVLGYNLVSNMLIIRNMNIQKKELKNKIVDLVKEKEALETDILKLEDPDYIAKYVRERYFYSKDGEFILRNLD